MKKSEPTLLDRLLDPVGSVLTPEVAEKFVRLRFDRKTQAHIDRLARKCNEGTLAEAERAEYERAVQTIDFIALLQAKANAVLKQTAAAR